MANIEPIRTDVTPKFDVERELTDYMATRVRAFSEAAGKPPRAVAVVLIGDDGKGVTHTSANSWSPDNSKSRFETCSVASALLLQRAIKD